MTIDPRRRALLVLPALLAAGAASLLSDQLVSPRRSPRLIATTEYIPIRRSQVRILPSAFAGDPDRWRPGPGPAYSR